MVAAKESDLDSHRVASTEEQLNLTNARETETEAKNALDEAQKAVVF